MRAGIDASGAALDMHVIEQFRGSDMDGTCFLHAQDTREVTVAWCKPLGAHRIKLHRSPERKKYHQPLKNEGGHEVPIPSGKESERTRQFLMQTLLLAALRSFCTCNL